MERPWIRLYEKHVTPYVKYPNIPIHRFLTDTASKHPEYIAMTFNDADTSYRELNEKVNAFASALQAAGVKKGDRVAFQMVNSPVYVIGFFAAMKIGAIVVNMSVGIQGDELVRCLNDSGAKTFLTLDIFAQNLYKVIKDTGIDRVILHSVFGLEKKIEINQGEPAFQIFSELLAGAQSTGEPAVDVFPEDVAVLQYTSGSTGRPKAATLTHSNIVASVLQTDAWVNAEGPANSAVICIIPFFHVFGLSASLLVSVLKGYRMILLPRIDLMDIISLLKTLDKYRPISFPAVPSLWTALLSSPAESLKQHLSSIQVASSGGAPLSPEIHARFEELTGKKIMEAYGLSEASSATHITPFPNGAPRGSIGLPLPDTEAKIMDMESGSEVLGTDEVGELVVKGPQIMRGYWENPELTSKVLRDGWFYTGDMARVDKEGYFYIVDRKDDLIISNGFNIYPAQIEEVLKQHPKVKDAAVVGTPDRVRGQAIIAVIALKEGLEGDRDEFMAFCKENLPEYRMPKTVLIRKDIPRDPAGKIFRRILRQESE